MARPESVERPKSAKPVRQWLYDGIFEEQTMTRLSVLFLVAVSFNALAYDSDGVKEHFGKEIAECAAYYAITEEISNRFGNAPAAMEANRNFEKTMEMGRMLTTDDLTQVRYERALEAEAKTNNTKNGYAKLFRRYGKSCQSMMDDPGARIKYWEKKK